MKTSPSTQSRMLYACRSSSEYSWNEYSLLIKVLFLAGIQASQPLQFISCTMRGQHMHPSVINRLFLCIQIGYWQVQPAHVFNIPSHMILSQAPNSSRAFATGKVTETYSLKQLILIPSVLQTLWITWEALGGGWKCISHSIKLQSKGRVKS